MALVLAATPIGQVEDASPRLATELAAADIVAAEDTRRLHRLASDLGVSISGRVVSYFDGNERQRTGSLIEAMTSGQRVVLVTDAGMPSISDPGYRLVAAAVEAGISVVVIPGPSAVLAALAISGLPVDRFCFEGFLPRKRGERSRRLAELEAEQRTMVFFEAPHRTAVTLDAMRTVFGAGRRGAVCRELTKVHEEVQRATLDELFVWADRGVRGEVTIVVEGATAQAAGAELRPDQIRALVDEQMTEGSSRKDAITSVARATGLPRRAVYAAAHSQT